MTFFGIACSSFLLAVFFLKVMQRTIASRPLFMSQGVPLIGGLGMGAAFFTAIFLCHVLRVPLPAELTGLLSSSFVMLFFGFMDDRRELSVGKKFLVQIIATSLLIAFGVRTRIVLLNEPLNLALSFIWIIGITNAINLLDVMDGLAGSVTLVILLSFAGISFLNNDMGTLIFCLSLAGAVLGFLFFNFPPAKIYMGNSGSHFLGFLLAAISLTVKYATLENQFALLAPLVILGFPVFDTLFLVLMRLKKGQSAFNKSEDHMALRFLKIGLSKGKTLLVMLFWALFFALIGALLTRVSDLMGWLLLAFSGFSMFVFGKKMARIEV